MNYESALLSAINIEIAVSHSIIRMLGSQSEKIDAVVLEIEEPFKEEGVKHKARICLSIEDIDLLIVALKRAKG